MKMTKHLTATAPTKEGTFEGEIDANPSMGDWDGERIETWTNLPTTVQLHYTHIVGDPGAIVGSADVMMKENGHLLVLGRLDIHGDNMMAAMVFERMLLPARDKQSLSELSVGFDYDSSLTYKDRNGIRVIQNATLLEVSVVYRGAQTTTIRNVKSRPAPKVKSALSNLMADTVDAVHREVCCTNCGRYQRVPLHPEQIYGERIYIGVYECCGVLFGFSPKSWSRDKWVNGMRQVRERLTKSMVDDVMAHVGPLFARFGLFHPSVQRELRDRVHSSIQFNEGIDRDDLSLSLHSFIDAHSEINVPNGDGDLLKALDELDRFTKSANAEITVDTPVGRVSIGDTVWFRVGDTVLAGDVQGISPDDTILITRSHGHRRYYVRVEDVVEVVSSPTRRTEVGSLTDDPTLAASVEALIAEVRSEKRAEEAAAKNLDELNMRLRAETTEAERDEREADQRATDEAERDRLAAERDLEHARAEWADEARRQADWRHAGTADWKVG
jgi:hypothetical protein